MLFQDFLTTVNNLINVRFHDLWNYDSQVILKLLFFFFSYGTPYSQKMNLIDVVSQLISNKVYRLVTIYTVYEPQNTVNDS